VEPQVSEGALTFALAALSCPVKEIRLIRSRDPAAEHKGFAFVDLYTPDAAARAVAALDGQALEGQARRVRVSLARESRAPRAGAAGGPQPLCAQPVAEGGAPDGDAAPAWQPLEFDAAAEAAAEADASAAAADAAAAPAAASGGFTLDPTTGYFYDAASGYYYDSQTGLYCHAASGVWYSADAATGQYVAVAAGTSAPGAQQPEPAPEAEAAPARRPGAVIGSAPKLTAEAVAKKERAAAAAAAAAAQQEQQAQAAAAHAARVAAAVPAAPVTVVAGGKVYGGKIRVPKVPQL
jgi:RNA-binding protein 5/10